VAKRKSKYSTLFIKLIDDTLRHFRNLRVKGKVDYFMNNIKNTFLVSALSLGLLVGAAGVAAAATSANYPTPCTTPVAHTSGVTGATITAGIVAGLTGQSVEEITAQRAAGTTYRTIAQEAGKLDEFKTENLVQKKVLVDQRVKDGNLTQAQADQIYNSIEANQATCDGTGSAGIDQRNGAGFGQGQGMGIGAGAGKRNGGCRR